MSAVSTTQLKQTNNLFFFVAVGDEHESGHTIPIGIVL